MTPRQRAKEAAVQELRKSQDQIAQYIDTSMNSFMISEDDRTIFDKKAKNNKNIDNFDWYKLNDDTVKFQQEYEENEVVSIISIFIFNFTIFILQPPPGMDHFMTEGIKETGQFMYKF